MTTYTGTLPSGPGSIVVYKDTQTTFFKSSRTVAQAHVEDNGQYRLVLGAGTFRVRVSTISEQYPEFTVTSTASPATTTLPLTVPIQRNLPWVPPAETPTNPGTGTGGIPPRSEVTVASPHAAVFSYLPKPAAPGGTIRTINVIHLNSSTTFPLQVTWTEASLISIKITNLSSNTSNMNVGVGNYGSTNHTTEPDVVAPGQSWIGTSGARPVFARASTAGASVWALVETVRSA